MTHLFIDGQWVSPRVPASAEVLNRSWALSNSEHCPAGGPERSWVAWSGGLSRKAVTVFRHGRGRRWAWRDPPSLFTHPARGRSGGSSHGPILWSGSCHTCASSRPRTFCVLLKDSTRERYGVREITIRRTVPYPFDQSVLGTVNEASLAEYQEIKHIWHNTSPAPAGWFKH